MPGNSVVSVAEGWIQLAVLRVRRRQRVAEVQLLLAFGSACQTHERTQ